MTFRKSCYRLVVVAMLSGFTSLASAQLEVVTGLVPVGLPTGGISEVTSLTGVALPLAATVLDVSAPGVVAVQPLLVTGTSVLSQTGLVGQVLPTVDTVLGIVNPLLVIAGPAASGVVPTAVGTVAPVALGAVNSLLK
jgi:hypothetical protein